MNLTKNYTIISKINITHLMCQLCFGMFKQPIRLHPCGHTFCQQCIPKKLKKCQICKEKIKAQQPDLMASKLMDEIMVSCNSKDCPWKGELNEFQYHYEKCALKKGGIDAWLKQVMLCIDGKEGEKQSQQQYSGQPPKQSDQQQKNTSVVMPFTRVDKNQIADNVDEQRNKTIKIWNCDIY